MRLSFPLIAAELTYGVSPLIATIMMAHLGRDALAANALVWGMYISAILLSLGTIHAVGVMVAHSYGAKNKEGIRITLTQGLILSAILAVPMMLIMWFAPKILYWVKQDPSIIKLTVPYFHALIWCMLPLHLSFTIQQMIVGISLTRIITVVSFFKVGLDILLFYILIFGKLGMPKLGVAGIGYALATVSTLMCIMLVAYVYYSPTIRKYKLFSNSWRINRKYIFELLRIGLPIGIMYCLEVALITAIAFLMGWLGKNMLAAHQIAHQCFLFPLMMMFGISQGATIRIGHAVGRNDKPAVKLAAYVNLGFGFVLMFIISIFYFSIPKNVVAFYVGSGMQNQTVMQYAAVFLSIAGVLQLTECIRLICLGILRGLKDTKIPLLISIISFWLIAFPSAYLLAFTLHFGGAGIWWGMVIGLGVAAIILLIRVKTLSDRVNLAALVTK